ncbi:FAD/NAD(P)-binding domain-containing protein [Gymnopus androsaceus JB14]|uniref:FAD/NAD(P)-binding domain-containing protein n=1 Tax=Gymnopus androsaceus JB14 TaxID=1447944 RepID=A0A6A4HXD6_9AGAR|nr:FAD/NAD(P)-binding domain-containing protein [Gymnopus androsaceus JB14]
MSEDSAVIRPRKILVVGGGAAGLVTLRNLVERGQFEKVVLVERRDDVGGVWYQDEPIIPSNTTSTINKPQWPSPAYPGLVGNVLPRFLSFSENPFPKTPNHPHQPFPSLAETYQYLRAFAEPYIEKGQIRLNTEVMRVEELPQKKGWKVHVRDWSECENNEGVPLEAEEIWDGVAICAGYYDKPNWPDTEGLDVVRKKGLALHAKWWNGPDGYEGKRALVIGNANSSNDIASQLAPVAQCPVYRSVRRPTAPWFPSLPDSRIQSVGPVRKYILQPADEDKTDRKFKDIDVVILGTGYCPHPEFVHVLPIDNASSGHVSIMSYTDPVQPQTRRVPFLYRHILYSYNESLAFIGAILAMTPFIVADVASTWLTLSWLGETPYPTSLDSRLAFDRARIAKVEKMLEAEAEASKDSNSESVEASFLGTGEGGEAEYANDLRRDIVQARPELDKVLPVWGDDAIAAMVEMFPTKYEALKWSQMHSV